jgi:hypothetical protein
MKKIEAEPAIRSLVHKWASAVGVDAASVVLAEMLNNGSMKSCIRPGGID